MSLCNLGFKEPLRKAGQRLRYLGPAIALPGNLNFGGVQTVWPLPAQKNDRQRWGEAPPFPMGFGAERARLDPPKRRMPGPGGGFFYFFPSQVAIFHFCFWLRPGISHEMTLELVYGANVGCVLHHLSSLTRLNGSGGQLWPKPTQNNKKIKLK